MTDDSKAKKENSDDSGSRKAEYEGDLNFATDSTIGNMFPQDSAGGNSAADQAVSGQDADAPNCQDADRPASTESGEVDLSDTWVPDGEGANSQSTEENATTPEKTWVPTGTPTFDGSETPAETQSSVPADDAPGAGNNDIVDPDKTHVPAATPTVHGLDAPAKQIGSDTVVPHNVDDVGKTGPRDETETIAGSDHPDAAVKNADGKSAAEFDKTWVSPVVPFDKDDGQQQSSDEEVSPPDVDKTFVPTGTPTFDGSEAPTPQSDNENVFEKTAVIEQPPETSDDLGAGTIVMPRDEGASTTDSAAMATVVTELNPEMDQTHDFSKTMGMRGLTEDEFDEWQEEVAEKSRSDTDVFEEPGNAGTDSTSGKRTQIWSKQTGDGLDRSLTIRSSPVAGDKQFESGAQADKPDYQIVEKLAEGGMGAIYVASQTSLGREIAIKTLKPLKEGERRNYESQGRISQVNRQRREMFLSEALVTANLVHPHIIPIHDLCETADNAPFYVMKRVNGTPWNELVTEMTIEENLEVLHKVCDAMAYAHHNGVVNRDLKPENIMLGEFGEVLVLDWGLAVPSLEADKKQFTSPSASFGAGTPAYMSPELWAGPADKIGTWSDIYLLGAILFEIVTGKAPHKFPEPDSKTGNSGLWVIIDNVVRKNEIRETDATGELLDIALKAMATEPGDRHRTVLEFQEAIKNYQKHEESRRLAARAAETLGHSVSKERRERESERGTYSDDHQNADRSATERRLGTPDREQGYQNYQTAAALYEEACNAWPENHDARKGLRETRLAYAELAHAKGDFDLGLQIASDEEGDEFVTLSRRLAKARRLRNGLKYATMLAVLVIVIVGAISFKQKQEITALVGTKEALEVEVKEAEKKKSEAEEKVVEAAEKVVAAEEQVRIADQKVIDADEKVVAADRKVKAANTRIEEANEKLAGANAKVAMVETELSTAEDKLKEADAKLVDATMKVREADQKLLTAATKLTEANTQIAVANKKVAETKIEVGKLEVQKKKLTAEKERLDKERIRADVELRNASIASLIRNADYSAALQRVNDLLTALNNDPQLTKLPADERQQRAKELQARQRQLLRRTKATESPVQAQVVSPSGRILVWGDGNGLVSVFSAQPGSTEIPDTAAHTLKLDSPISLVQIANKESLIVIAAGSKIHLWSFAEEDADPPVIDGHDAIVTALVANGDTILSADRTGVIKAWRTTDRKELWSVRSGSEIRDLAVMPDAGIFLYAGSRGGESSDILAYQLPSGDDAGSRPNRLGQLRLPRSQINPPRRIRVSPNEKLLLISNSRNGDIMALPRAPTQEVTAKDRFPFVHASDLAIADGPEWIASRHQRPVNDIVFSADGSRVATASDDRTIGIWKVGLDGDDVALEFTHRLEGHGARVNAAAFIGADAAFVLSAGADRFCRLWDLEHYEEQKKAIEAEFNLAAIEENIQATVFPQIPSRYILTSGANDRHADQRESDVDAEYRIINSDGKRQRGSLKSIDLNADGTRLVTGAADGTAVIWDTETGKPITGMSTREESGGAAGAFDEGHDFNVARLRFLPPAGNVLLTTGFEGNLCLWNANASRSGAGYEQLRVPGLGLVNAIATSSDGELIVASSAESDQQRTGTVSVWSTATLLKEAAAKPLLVLQGFHRAEVSSCAVSSSSEFLATGALDGRVAVWSLKTGKRLAGGQLHAKNTIVSHLHWLSDNEIVSAGFDGRLIRLRMESVPVGTHAEASAVPAVKLKTVTTFQHDKIPVERVSFAPDGDRFVTISVRTDRVSKQTSYEMELWNVTQGLPVRHILPAIVKGKAGGQLTAANWSPDGQLLASVVDGNLQLFETTTWKIVKVLEAPGLGISDAVFAPSSPPGKSILATFDGTASHLWNLTDYSHIAAFRPLYAVESLAISSDAAQSVLLTGDRAIRIFDADPNSPSFGQTLGKLSDPHRGVVTNLLFTDSSGTDDAERQFVSAGADGSAALWQWNPQDHEAVLVRWLRKDGPPFVAISFSSEAVTMLLLDGAGNVLVPDLSNPNAAAPVTRIETGSNTEFAAAALHPDGTFFAVAGQDAESGESVGWVYAIADDKLSLHCTIRGHEAGGIRGIAFLPHSPHIVTGGADGDVLLWNWQPSRAAEAPLQAYEAFQFLLADQPKAHDAPVTSVSVSKSGKIATASKDGTAIVWQNPFRR